MTKAAKRIAGIHDGLTPNELALLWTFAGRWQDLDGVEESAETAARLHITLRRLGVGWTRLSALGLLRPWVRGGGRVCLDVTALGMRVLIHDAETKAAWLPEMRALVGPLGRMESKGASAPGTLSAALRQRA
jgi:hypothetical protein